ncbi:MAG: hypothetical protein ACREN8_09865 [Candidatus Dormibacteraceae bacterium]
MAAELNHLLSGGSGTSGVDGSSEGGRLSTSRLGSILSLYSAALLQELRRQGCGNQLSVAPSLRGGRWVIEVTHQGTIPRWMPELWQGHRVVLRETNLANPAGS